MSFPSICADCSLLLPHRFLPPHVSIIGYARSKLSDQDLREKLKPHLKAAAEVVERFLSLVTYISGPYDTPEGFQKLNKALTAIEHKDGGAPSGRMFYLALPPSVYPEASCLRHTHFLQTAATAVLGGKE